jgi:hypothetical protein
MVWGMRIDFVSRERQPARLLSVIRRAFPHAGDREISFLLWNCTAFPCAGTDYVAKQVVKAALVCAPTSRRGWWRKLQRYAAWCEAEMMRAAREIESARERENERHDTSAVSVD